MQIKNSAKEYDVIIVGSGAGGGMATKILSEAGLSVAVVEAGPYYDPANPEQMTQLKWAWHSPRRGAGTRRFFGDYDQAYGGWEIDGADNLNNGYMLPVVSVITCDTGSFLEDEIFGKIGLDGRGLKEHL